VWATWLRVRGRTTGRTTASRGAENRGRTAARAGRVRAYWDGQRRAIQATTFWSIPGHTEKSVLTQPYRQKEEGRTTNIDWADLPRRRPNSGKNLSVRKFCLYCCCNIYIKSPIKPLLCWFSLHWGFQGISGVLLFYVLGFYFASALHF
jgi:hypothetical protein